VVYFKQNRRRMKLTLLVFLAGFILTPAVVSAQTVRPVLVTTSSSATAQDVNGFTAKKYPGFSTTEANRAPNPNVVLKPRVTGIFVDGAKYGTEIISPTAPDSWGMGEKYLSAPSPSRDLEHEDYHAAHRDAGGLKLFSLEF
jgi:hypothetical protein